MPRKANINIEIATKNFLNRTKRHAKTSTIARYTFVCEKHIIPFFQNTEVTAKSVQRFIAHKTKQGGLNGKPLSPKSIHDMAGLLLQILKPYQLHMDIVKPTYTSSEISIFSEGEHNRLKAYVSTATDSKKLGIIVVMLTGIRLGELCALKWENIDLENEHIFINKTMQRIAVKDAESKTKIMIDMPKSKNSVRKIPIPSVLSQMLKQFQSYDDTYLLTNTRKHIEPRAYQKYFKACLHDCDIKDNNFHALRHTFATNAVAKGVDIKTLSLLLGHTDVAFTMKRYVHPHMEHRRMQIEKMAVGF